MLEKQNAGKEVKKEEKEVKQKPNKKQGKPSQADLLESFMEHQKDNPNLTLKEFMAMVDDGKVIIERKNGK